MSNARHASSERNVKGQTSTHQTIVQRTVMSAHRWEEAVEIVTKPNEFITPHFKFSDIVCPCCERVKILPGTFRHMAILEDMRNELGFPLIINSGYRCPDHNRRIGGAARSWHMIFATDVRPAWRTEADDGTVDDVEFLKRIDRFRKLAETIPEIGGIGRYNTFTHIDTRLGRMTWRG